MAARLLSPGRRVVLYKENLQSFCAAWRNFSSEGRNSKKSVPDESIASWLNIRAGIFGPSDQRLPLPGDVGVGQSLHQEPRGPPRVQKNKALPDVLTASTYHESQVQVYSQISNVGEMFPDSDVTLAAQVTEEMPKPTEILECRVQECPELMKKDFSDLFPDRNLKGNTLSILTLSQKTTHDMSAWSEDMELEREELIEYFVMAADDICATIRNEGYWADFIDPCSGRPFRGEYTSATLFETDERYRFLGFKIEDLGCCKIISHRLWGTHVFVGAIFTNAPVDSDIVQEALCKHKKTKE